jgi:general L-amino acid transport system permease protein
MRSAGRWVRANLFESPGSACATLLFGGLLAWAGFVLVDWGVIHAVWHVPHGPDGWPDVARCRVPQAGACWAIVHDKLRLVLFGSYPPGQQWRPALATLTFLLLYAVSAMQRFWRRGLLGVWAAGLMAVPLLMRGGILGLPLIQEDQWGGLPVTLMLATYGLAVAFPLSILVALARMGRRDPVLRWMSILYVELIRGVPLISLLFMATAMLPLVVPKGLNPDKLICAQTAIILFAAAYLSEVVRAGLQAVPPGQREAADALGFNPRQSIRLVLLPQALRLVLPALTGTFIGFFKDTSLVVVIGLSDLMMTGHMAVLEPAWQGFGTEIYLLLALIYFLFCFALSRLGHRFERSTA